MKLQDQVITIDQAKRLKELGVVQESLFYYNKRGGLNYRNSFELVIAAAFTVAELGVMLGEYTDFILYNSEAKKWDVGDSPEYVESFLLEAQARAAYLIHLLETGQLSVEVVNGRARA